ncbi:MAG: S-layer homology domain-containing protein, partial [Lachnospiraceae bacterium]|nr:S-layer homology domain-containing protein [Lachnospiraceae bacterium]
IPAVGSKPDDTYKAGSWDVTPSTETAITGATTYTYTYAQKESISATVTFKVANGKWNDETTADKTVTLTGYEGDTLKLSAAQIPAVGSKPDDTYKAGSWDVTPSTETAITGATTYTYTYAQKETAVVTIAPTAKTLTNTGSAQELVTAGKAEGGTMQYALGTATEATEQYTTSIPTATDAGTYYVWYKVVGDDVHLDTDPVCIKVKILNTGMFADIEYGTWKYTAAEAVYDKKIMVGKGMVDGKIIFAPDDKVNRSQLVTSIYAMDGKPAVDYVQQFSDVNENDWFAKAVTWAANNGITAGTGAGQFGVTGNATREQVAVMLYKYAKYCGYDVSISESTTLDGFADADKVHDWALDAVKWAVERKIISGKGSGSNLKIAPEQGATRIECAAMLNKFSEVCTVVVIPDEILEEPLALPMEDIEETPASEDQIEDVIVDEDEEIIDEEDSEVVDEESDVIDEEDSEVADEESEVIDEEESEVTEEDSEAIDEEAEVIDNQETEE